MEPVKGGSLINLPPKALELMEGVSPANFAIRYAAGFDNTFMTLSGMSNLEQMQDNLSFMRDFQPLTYREQEIISQVRTLYQAQHRIPCTACRYCVDGCPAGIPIPGVFAAMNAHLQQEEGAAGQYAAFENNASACIGCGQCEAICPQQLHIRSLLQEVEKAFA